MQCSGIDRTCNGGIIPAMTPARRLAAKTTRTAVAFVAAGLVVVGSSGIADAATDDNDQTQQHGQYGNVLGVNSLPNVSADPTPGSGNAGISNGYVSVGAGPSAIGDIDARAPDSSTQVQYGAAIGGTSSPGAWVDPTLGGNADTPSSDNAVARSPFGTPDSLDTPIPSTPIVMPAGQQPPATAPTSQGAQSASPTEAAPPIIPAGAPRAQH